MDTTLKENEIAIDGGIIVIQSCDNDWANVGVWLRVLGRITYYHVDIPSLVRQWRPVYYNEAVKPVEFDRILQDNKTILLRTIGKLNGSNKKETVSQLSFA